MFKESGFEKRKIENQEEFERQVKDKLEFIQSNFQKVLESRGKGVGPAKIFLYQGEGGPVIREAVERFKKEAELKADPKPKYESSPRLDEESVSHIFRGEYLGEKVNLIERTTTSTPEYGKEAEKSLKEIYLEIPGKK